MDYKNSYHFVEDETFKADKNYNYLLEELKKKFVKVKDTPEFVGVFEK